MERKFLKASFGSLTIYEKVADFFLKFFFLNFQSPSKPDTASFAITIAQPKGLYPIIEIQSQTLFALNLNLVLNSIQTNLSPFFFFSFSLSPFKINLRYTIS